MGAACVGIYIIYYLHFPLKFGLACDISLEFLNFKFILRGSYGAVFIGGYMDFLRTHRSYGAKAVHILKYKFRLAPTFSVGLRRQMIVPDDAWI
jgi:hypothetical protein